MDKSINYSVPKSCEPRSEQNDFQATGFGSRGPTGKNVRKEENSFNPNKHGSKSGGGVGRSVRGQRAPFDTRAHMNQLKTGRR